MDNHITLTTYGHNAFLRCPFLPSLVRRVELLKGVYDYNERNWVFPISQQDKVAKLCLEIFGEDGSPSRNPMDLRDVQIHFTCELLSPPPGLLVFNRNIARNYHDEANVEVAKNVTMVSHRFRIRLHKGQWHTYTPQGTVIILRDLPLRAIDIGPGIESVEIIVQPLRPLKSVIAPQSVHPGQSPRKPHNPRYRPPLTSERQQIAFSPNTLRTDTMIPFTDRLYLAVPYPERAEAKRSGAHYDILHKAWYVDRNKISEVQKRWNPGLPEQSNLTSGVSLEHQFQQFLLEHGAQFGTASFPHLLQIDGKKHRISVSGDVSGRRSGEYCCYLDNNPHGYLKNYRTDTYHQWEPQRRHLPLEQHLANQANLLVTQQRRETKHRQQMRASRKEFIELWSSAAPAPTDHPYLLRHSPPHETIPPLLARKHHDDLLLPLYDRHNALVGLQTISPLGDKRFLRRSTAKDTHCLINSEQIDVSHAHQVVLCEGFATGVSLAVVTQLPVYICYTASNLEPVTELLLQQFSRTTIFIAGDDDHEPACKQPSHSRRNTGRQYAASAAKLLDTQPIFPPTTQPPSKQDWNDYHVQHGTDTTRTYLETNTAIDLTHIFNAPIS